MAPTAFKAAGRSDPATAGSIPVHLRHFRHGPEEIAVDFQQLFPRECNELGGAGVPDGLDDDFRVVPKLLVDEPVRAVPVVLRLPVAPAVLCHLVDPNVPASPVRLDQNPAVVVVQSVGPALPFSSPRQVNSGGNGCRNSTGISSRRGEAGAGAGRG